MFKISRHPSCYYIVHVLKTLHDFDLNELSSVCSSIIRFQTVAYLVQMWWLEVSGELEFKFPPDTYSLFFRLQLGKSSKKFGRRICNLEHIHGWEIKPVRFQLTTSDGQHVVSECHLDNPGSWILYHGGDFVIKDSNKLTKIEFALTQIDCTHIKGGLSLDSVFICPKSIVEGV